MDGIINIKEHEFISAVIDTTKVLVFVLDAEGRIFYFNKSCEVVTGYLFKEIRGRRFPELFLVPEEVEAGKIFFNELQSGQFPKECVSYWKAKDGSRLLIECTYTILFDRDGSAKYAVGTGTDITEYKGFELRLKYLADHDPLTDLFNRSRFLEELERELACAQRYGRQGALLVLDVDNFKYINDVLGHQEGDRLLASLAEVMKKRLRKTDIIARMGGDEFAIFLSNISSSNAQSVAQQIIELVRCHIRIFNEQSAGITVSVGIAILPEHGDTTTALLACADLAMYQAKETGRNRVCIYTPDQKIKIESRLSWEKHIRSALERDRFVLHLQPILDLKRNCIVGHEALLRMIGVNEELIPPGEFLDIAEHFGLIHDIDRWVIRRAIQLITEQKMMDKGLYLEVNLSGKAFADTGLLPLIEQELIIRGVKPINLVLEITETAVITNMSEAQYFINKLKSIGCRFALDDFGSGFSSFYYLKHLPVDYLKIDGSFIRNLTQDQADQQIVKAMVEIARGLGKETIAEFVGNKETVRLLRNYGVNYVQGYHIGMPASEPEIV